MYTPHGQVTPEAVMRSERKGWKEKTRTGENMMREMKDEEEVERRGGNKIKLKLNTKAKPIVSLTG